MTETILRKQKALYRELLRSLEASLEEESRSQSDQLLLERFLNLEQLAEAKTVLLYYGVGAEIWTAALLPELLARGKRVCFPRCLPGNRLEARLVTSAGDLVPGAYGIPEPKETCPVIGREELDLILVPSAGCDLRGARLGKGGGYYDRYLAGWNGFSVCLCRNALLQEEIPRQAHDVPMRLVLTETREIVPG